MKIWIAGSRSITEYFYVVFCLRGHITKNDIVRTGGAKGVDQLAERYCKRNKYPMEEPIIPDWRIGRHAGILRNIEGVTWADKILIIWDGVSKGTQHVISEAKRQGKPCELLDLKK